MITTDIQTRKEELIALISKWAEEKSILEADEVIEVDVRITKPSKVRVSLEGYHGLGNIDQMSVNDLGLSVRAGNCLSNMGIQTVGQLRQLKLDDLLGKPNMGKKSIREYRDKLQTVGIKVDWVII
ncbi:MAG: DNA-directed RNA polymerase subunit alpha C-terminal domain-containing protein [bacterium]|nr:DNA-directed RNA polymerase subunit alpha C-terminal domain-containing protein [bacterium]